MAPGLLKDRIIDHPLNKASKMLCMKYVDDYMNFYFGECGEKVNFNLHSNNMKAIYWIFARHQVFLNVVFTFDTTMKFC